MIKIKLHQLFYGGISTDRKVGIAYSHGYSRAIDFRKRPGRLSILPQGSEIGNNNVVDLVQNIIQVDDGTRYAFGDTGWLYKINTSDVVTPITKLDSGASGMLYRRDMDEFYVASQKTVSRYGKLSNNPVIDQNKYKSSRSEDEASLRQEGDKTTELDATINEEKRIEFTPDIEPLSSFKIKPKVLGTGDWTLTMHDDANNVMATVTIVNASLLKDGNGLLEFVMSDQIRMLVSPNARTYHMHITTSDGTGSITTSEENNMNTAIFEVWADRLIETNSGIHPIAQFLQYTCIGNEQYLSTWEPLSENPSNLEWLRHRLVLPTGYEIIDLASTDEFLVIAAEKRSTNSQRNFQSGKLFFWDGTSQTYNRYIDVPEGSPQSLFPHNNMVYMIINGALYVWPGGKELIKLRTFENTDNEFSGVNDNTQVYSNMIAIKKNILLFGYPSYTTNTNLEYGIYSWGQREKNFPMSFGLDYDISTKTRYNTNGNLYIGGLWNFGDTLYISWRDQSNYGLDVINNSSTPNTSAVWESMEFDAGDPTHEKQALSLSLELGSNIPSGYTILPKVRYDWSSNWEYGDALTSSNKYKMELSKRFKSIEYGFDISHDGTSTEPMEIMGIEFAFDSLEEEREW